MGTVDLEIVLLENCGSPKEKIIGVSGVWKKHIHLKEKKNYDVLNIYISKTLKRDSRIRISSIFVSYYQVNVLLYFTTYFYYYYFL